MASAVFFVPINFLSGWGLGGTQPLARAKASVDLCRLSIRMLENLFFDFLLERFWEGVRGNAFSREKGSPAFLLIYLSSGKDSRYSSKRARGGRRSGMLGH